MDTNPREHTRSEVPSNPDLVSSFRADGNARLAHVFVGPEGWMAIPRWLIYLVLALLLFFGLGAIVTALHLRNHLWSDLGIEISMLVAAIAPGFVMARLEDRPFGEFGLPARGAFSRNFWVGAWWGIGWLSILLLLLRGLGAFSLGSLAVHDGHAVRFAIYYAIFFLATAFFEEFLWRGYSQWVLTRGMNFWPAAALLSISFGAIHIGNSGESRVGIVAVMVMGLFFALTLRRTGDLWWAVGFHMSWDWGESFLYSVPDSGTLATGHLLNSSFHGPDWLTGGTVGPEGSYLVFVLLATMWVVFDRVYPSKVRSQKSNCKSEPNL